MFARPRGLDARHRTPEVLQGRAVLEDHAVGRVAEPRPEDPDAGRAAGEAALRDVRACAARSAVRQVRVFELVVQLICVI